MKLLSLLQKTSGTSFIGAVFAGLVSGISSTGLIALINHAIANRSSTNALVGMSYIAMCVFLIVSMALSQLLLARLVQGITFKLRLQLTNQILTCPLRHLEELGAAKLLAALTEDVEAVSNASFQVANLCIAVAMFIACMFYMMWQSLPLFGIAVVITIVGISSHRVLTNKATYFLKLARSGQNELFAHFRTAIEGVKELKLHTARRQAFLTQELENSANSVKNYKNTATDIFAIASSWGFLFLFGPLGILVFVAPNFINLSTSVLSGYALILIFTFTMPLRVLLNTLPEISKADIALENIQSLGLSLASQNQEITNKLSNSDASKFSDTGINIELENVVHTYGSERDATLFHLGPMNLSFSPGELIFIVGGNGSGKSTLVKLITGLYIPESGAIYIDGKLVTDKNREWYRQHFSVVFYDFYLFERLLGIEHPDIETQATKYLEQLQLNHKVFLKDGRLSTTALSQGQRKRLALLTAYLEDRSIYVFDEWASDQDPVFRELFYTQLLPALKNRGKTVIAISHDDHYFYIADRIIKLDYGQVEYNKRNH
ncbi:ABC transporter ATP-binding protein [Calothrix sp. HK-06]|nr:ABC transporter ATP-binding protein [Calothrix sp. HK-06]